jgi:hypothetical protein
MLRFLSPWIIFHEIIPNKNKYQHCAHPLMAVSRMRFTFPGNGTYYIDLAAALSRQERRLHRQKQIYTVLGGYMKDQDGSFTHFNTAPLTWPVKRSVNRGFRMWKKMIAQTLSNTDGLQTGKWNDFKVYLDNQHGNGPVMPVDADGATGNAIASGEWNYSTLTTADPTETAAGVTLDKDAFELQIVGPHSGSGQSESNPNGYSRVSLIQSWVDSRARPVSVKGDPIIDSAQSAVVKADPLNNLFDAGDVDDDRIDIINEEGDYPPYDDEEMFGNSTSAGGSSNLQRVSSVQTSAASPIAMVMGFQALCGLVQVVIGGADSASELVLDVDTQGVKF